MPLRTLALVARSIRHSWLSVVRKLRSSSSSGLLYTRPASGLWEDKKNLFFAHVMLVKHAQRCTKRFIHFFQYSRQKDGDVGGIEMSDIVPPHTDTNPAAYYRANIGFNKKHHQHQQQPDLRQIAGIRHALTCTLRRGNKYEKM